MNVDKIIFSCDGSYFLFWEYVSEISKKILKVEPILFYINEEEETDFYPDKFGMIKKIKTLNFVNSTLLSQIYRFYGTRYFQDEVCLISDIDMFLFNKDWLSKNLKDVHEDDLVILNSDAYDSTRAENSNKTIRYPACYSVGKGKTFDKIINTKRSIEEYAEEISSLNAGWDSDEIFFSKKLVEGSHNVKYHLVKRGYSSYYYAPGRLEKYMFTGEEELRIGKLNLNGTVNFDSFIDCHAWKWNMELVSKLKNEMLEYYK
jgi:hypothetical protein